ncbi:MAG: hypothetical protein ACU84Q_00660 [Gammaproteobacteria bacterium]
MSDLSFDPPMGRPQDIDQAFESLDNNWRDSYIPFALDSLYSMNAVAVALS